jgi:tetratricopeptide (TPR) repeat protein
VLAGACVLACVCAAWFSVRAGLARLFAESVPGLLRAGRGAEAVRLAGEAARFNASDPEARLALARALAEGGEAGAALDGAERAAALRPRYYLSWLRLGRARELSGDTAGGEAAYREAVRLAPFYAEPRWQLGNLLLRAGRAEEAFAEVRLAAASRPALFGYTAETAWRVYGGDARAVAAVVAPQTPAARSALARFFARRGRAAEAVEQFRAGGREAGDAERRALVKELIEARAFREAHAVWSGGEASAGGAGEFADGGFEGRATVSVEGFGWQFARDLAGVRASLDVTEPRAGARSLLLEFEGAPDAGARLAAQLVVVEPGARYRLTFAARAAALVSGGPPFVAVLEAAGGGRTLAASKPLPRDAGWETYELEFDAPEGGAVYVVVRRQPCASAPCPVYGRAWFDEFELRIRGRPAR